MTKEVGLTMKLELMRDFVQRQRTETDYDTFLNEKVRLARNSVQAGRGSSNQEVELAFAARRAKALRAN